MIRVVSHLCLALWMALLISCSLPPQGDTPPPETPAEPVEHDNPMVSIPGGTFLYGATAEQVDFYIKRSLLNFPGMVEKLRKRFVTPQRQENVSEFQIQTFEVTNQEFAAFLDATNYQPRDQTHFLEHWKAGRPPDWAATFPVTWISQFDALAYCVWLGGRLPSEQEWEKAARGTDGRFFPWGNSMPTSETANSETESLEPVGNRPEDASPYQVYDMGGNVSEWTASTASEGSANYLVVRGGSYQSQARDMLVPYREFAESSLLRRDNLGFRCAK